MCGISIRVNGEWICKYDGADNTDVEGTKGGFSAAMKRAAVPWGVGRYLYGIGETFAVIDENGAEFGTCKDAEGKAVRFRWNPPKLPPAVLPGEQAKASQPQQSQPQAAPAPKKADQERGVKAASAPQLQLIERLAGEIAVNVEEEFYKPLGITAPDSKQAGAIIDRLKALKVSPAGRRKPLTEKEVLEAERAEMKAA